MSFIQAKNFTRVVPPARRAIDLVVLHAMQSDERPRIARDIAVWFADGHGDAPEASTHYCVDALETVQCVLEQDVAWGAGGANTNGVHIEMAGRSEQDLAGWRDAFSSAMIERTVQLTADVCLRRAIPPVFVFADKLKLPPVYDGKRWVAQARGITTHWEVTQAFRKGTHTDPGPAFPAAYFVQRVAQVLADLRGDFNQ